MSWNNAPKLNKLAASQQGGKRGAQLWGVDIKGKLYTCYQGSPGGGWSDWNGVGWNDPREPKGVYELAASQTGDGSVLFWALDLQYHLWSRQQTSAGGNWGPWRQDFQSPPGGTKLKKIAASASGGNQGSHLFGISESGYLLHINSTIPGGPQNWSAWADFPATPEKSRFIEVTACRQGEGRAAVWALDEKRMLWGAGQVSPGGKWGPWVGPNWLGAPRLRNIAAVEGMNGAIIVGQDEDYHVVSNFQNTPGSNSWRGWTTPFHDDPRSYELTAANQNNGVAQLWAITLGGALTTLIQKEAGHWNPDWSDRDKDSDLPTPHLRANLFAYGLRRPRPRFCSLTSRAPQSGVGVGVGAGSSAESDCGWQGPPRALQVWRHSCRSRAHCAKPGPRLPRSAVQA